ncbi:MAG: fbcH [Alphaproteobacteria bacterium]|nr:fbcH [Alphaproteobacteria bacterium]
MRKTISSFLIVLTLLAGFPALAAEEFIHPPKQDWSFEGPFGTFDRAELQRGFQVYKQVCAACHSMNYLSYRNLVDIGLSELEVKAIAAEYMVKDGPNDEGEMFERPALASDRFKAPFQNEKAARASNGGALPPDLSLITKARHDGPNYVYAILTGYVTPPADFKLGQNMNYNKFFPGHQIAMPPPLNSEGQVAYTDVKATPEQMAHDVTAFLTWAGEPKMELRKQMGIKVIIFLTIFAAIMYAVKRKIWRGLEQYED